MYFAVRNKVVLYHGIRLLAAKVSIGYSKRNAGMEKEKITIYDIAMEAGCSASLVSRVLSGKGSVSEKTRKRIQGIIDEYEFRPNAMARRLQERRTRIIGFMLPHIGNEYFSSVYYEFEKHASANGYMTILYNGKNDPATEEKILKVFDEVRVDAAVLMGGNIDAVGIDPKYAAAINVLNRRIPCILCNEQAEKFGCTGIHMDTAKGAKLMVEHLAERGYRSIGILGGALERYQTGLFRESIRKQAEKMDIEIRSEWIYGNSYNESDGEEAMQQLLKQKKLPQALCCINDYIAYGAMAAAKDAGFLVPQDIAFIGNNNLHISKLVRPKLTTIDTDFEAFGSLIFEQITASQKGEGIKQCRIEPKLVLRDST